MGLPHASSLLRWALGEYMLMSPHGVHRRAHLFPAVPHPAPCESAPCPRWGPVSAAFFGGGSRWLSCREWGMSTHFCGVSYSKEPALPAGAQEQPGSCQACSGFSDPTSCPASGVTNGLLCPGSTPVAAACYFSSAVSSPLLLSTWFSADLLSFLPRPLPGLALGPLVNR